MPKSKHNQKPRKPTPRRWPWWLEFTMICVVKGLAASGLDRFTDLL